MVTDGNYPEGADNCSSAPWKEKTNFSLKFNLVYSATVSKEVSIEDCRYTLDDDDNPILDNPLLSYSENNITIEELLQYSKQLAKYLLNKKDFQCLSKNILEEIASSDYLVDEEETLQI